jgi:hypothetical protein
VSADGVFVLVGVPAQLASTSAVAASVGSSHRVVARRSNDGDPMSPRWRPHSCRDRATSPVFAAPLFAVSVCASTS